MIYAKNLKSLSTTVVDKWCSLKQNLKKYTLKFDR